MTRWQVGSSAALIGVAALTLGVGFSLAAAPVSQLPPEKQALIDYANSVRLGGTPGNKAKDAGRPLVVQVDPAPVTGLLGGVQAPISGGQFTTNNAWAGWVNSTTYVITYAGAPSGDPTRGMIFIERHGGNAGVLDSAVDPVSSLVAAPAVGGPLQILRVDGNELVVGNPGGREFRFNPLTGAFD
jgi:hypothetical protein